MEMNNLLTFIVIVILFIIEGFFEVAILSIPGAFIRWMADGRKEAFSKYYKEKAKLNTILGILVFAMVFLITGLLIKTFAQ
jgi:hypothetical protein